MIELTDKQSELWHHLDDPQYTRYMIYGGSRSGKTITIIGWILSQMQKYPGLSVLCLRKYRTHIKTSLWEGTIKSLLKDRNDFIFEESSMTLTHKNGSVLRCDGLDTDERVDKVLGNEYAIIFVNEASQTDYSANKVAISRLAQNIEGFETRKMIYDLNPTGPLHWLYQMGIKGVDPETQKEINTSKWFTMQFTPLDNPYLPEDYLESLRNLTGVQKLRLYDGVFAAAENLVYPDYDPSIHVKNLTDYINENTDYIIGIDAGYDPDPMVIALFAVIQYNDQKCLYLKEVYMKKGKDMSISIGDYVERYRELNPYIVVDPSASPAILELQSRNFRCDKGNNRIVDGINTMRDLIATNRFFVDPKCANGFNEEIMSYELNPKTEKPTGNTPDHLIDCSRYVSMSFAEEEIGSNFYIF